MVVSNGGGVQVTEARFVLTDPEYLLVEASRRTGCRFEFRDIVPRGGDRYAEYFTLTGPDPDEVLALVEEIGDVDATQLGTDERGQLVELDVCGDCPVVSLARHGAVPRLVTAEAGTVRFVVEIPTSAEPSTVVSGFLSEHPAVELAAKRQRRRLWSLSGPADFERAVRGRLTDRQYQVVRTAFEEGYYEWPRERTGEDIAADLDISSATFSQHVAAAERKLLAVLFEDEE